MRERKNAAAAAKSEIKKVKFMCTKNAEGV